MGEECHKSGWIPHLIHEDDFSYTFDILDKAWALADKFVAPAKAITYQLGEALPLSIWVSLTWHLTRENFRKTYTKEHIWFEPLFTEDPNSLIAKLKKSRSQ